MYAQLCSCMKAQVLGSKSPLFLLRRTGVCCNQRYSSTDQDESHYDTLELKRNCSPTEVRAAFIRLSKELHPDRNPNNPSLHDKFVKLNEAYSTLHDMDLRRNYDASLNLKTVREKVRVYKSQRHKDADGDSDRDRPEDWEDYYDFQAQMKRNESIHVPSFLLKISSLSKTALFIAMAAVVTSLFGMQFLAVKYRNSLPKDLLTPKEVEISKNLMTTRSDAQQYDVQENINRFQERVRQYEEWRRRSL